MAKNKPKCMVCGAEGELVNGSVIYPHRKDLKSLKFYQCPACPSIYVGTHKNGKPKGPLMADAPTRAARIRAHNSFDKLWKFKIVSRNRAYELLAKFLGVSGADAHIGHLDERRAKEVATWADRHIRMYNQCGCIDEWSDERISDA